MCGLEIWISWDRKVLSVCAWNSDDSMMKFVFYNSIISICVLFLSNHLSNISISLCQLLMAMNCILPHHYIQSDSFLLSFENLMVGFFFCHRKLFVFVRATQCKSLLIWMYVSNQFYCHATTFCITSWGNTQI